MMATIIIVSSLSPSHPPSELMILTDDKYYSTTVEDLAALESRGDHGGDDHGGHGHGGHDGDHGGDHGHRKSDESHSQHASS